MITTGSPLVQCRWCPAKAVWATYEETNRRTLIDPTPTANGNLALTRSHGGLYALVVPSKDRHRHTELYVSHFVRCPGSKDRARVMKQNRETHRRSER